MNEKAKGVDEALKMQIGQNHFVRRAIVAFFEILLATILAAIVLAVLGIAFANMVASASIGSFFAFIKAPNIDAGPIYGCLSGIIATVVIYLIYVSVVVMLLILEHRKVTKNEKKMALGATSETGAGKAEK